MAKVAPITIRSTNAKFLCDLIDFLNKYPNPGNDVQIHITAHSHEEFNFDEDSGLEECNLMQSMAVALKNANQRLAKWAATGGEMSVDEWCYTQQTVSNALHSYEKLYGKVAEQPNVWPDFPIKE